MSVVQGVGTLVSSETRRRSRSPAAAVAVTVFVGLLLGAAALLFSSAVSSAPEDRPEASPMANAAFLVMAFQLGMVLLAAPALGSGAISGERRAGTFDLLMVGHLGPLDVVAGKAAAAATAVVLLVVAALPVAVAAFLHAGLTLGQLFLAELVTMVAALAVQSVAVLMSSMVRRTVAATVSTYAVVGMLYGATASAAAPPALAYANPFAAMARLATGTAPSWLAGRGGSWDGVIRPWQASVVAQAGLTALCLVLAARSVAGRRTRPAPQARPAHRRPPVIEGP